MGHAHGHRGNGVRLSHFLQKGKQAKTNYLLLRFEPAPRSVSRVDLLKRLMMSRQIQQYLVCVWAT